MNTEVVGIQRRENRIDSVVISCNGQCESMPGTDFVSSMPVTEFLKKLDSPPPPTVLEAAERLRYRDFLTVCVVVNQPNLFPDNWLYIHAPER
jgi:protoporphyrinogen oxidase